MLKRLYNSIFKAEEIGKYLKDKVGYVLLYILFLSLIATIPSAIKIGVSNQADESLKKSYITKIQYSEFNGQIVNYTYLGEGFSLIDLGQSVYFGAKTNDINRLGFVAVLEENSIDLYLGGQKVNSFSYTELELDNLDFKLTENIDRQKLSNSIDIIYKKYKTYNLIYSSLAEVLTQAVLVILLIMIFVWIYSFSQPKLLMKYRFVIASYASTVYFLTLLLDNLFGVEFISLIGVFIMGFNLRKAYARLIQITIIQKRKDQEEDE